MEQVVRQIVAAYGVKSAHILPAQKGYRNHAFPVVTGSQKLNVIVYKNEPDMRERIARANALGDFLHAQNMPARHTFDARILQLKNAHQTRYASIYFYQPGHTIPWESYTMERVKNVGKTMGDMHAALQNYRANLPFVADELIALNRRMLRYFADKNVARAIHQKLGLRVLHADFLNELLACKKLPAQALHMDFVRGNILFDGDEITGILDFEKAAIGHPVFDIARTLAFLLVDCKYKPAAKMTKYFLQSGYNKRSQSTFTNWQELNQLLPFFLLHDFYKFLRHNPYEYLPQNEHFVRTKTILVKLGVLSVK